jgi:hypothetical protein
VRALLTLIALLAAGPVGASGIEVSRVALELESQYALSLDDGSTSQARAIVRPSVRLQLPARWTAELELRGEVSGSDTGLGALAGYDDASRPWSPDGEARVEIEQALLRWRRGGKRLTLGKQTLAWGVLDGLQVTDRMDAVRRREAFFTEPRPDRIARWGARAEFRAAGLRVDAVVLADGTVDQLPGPQDTYAIRAPRLRAGLPASAPTPPLAFDVPDAPTLGLRLSRSFGASELGILVIDGPDTEPVFVDAGGAVGLTYASRTLFGATFSRSAGSRVWRMEAAWVPEQPFNLAGPVLTVDTRRRVLGGVGLDWRLPRSLLVNAQLAVDRAFGDDLVRPRTDVIATLRAERRFANDRWRLSSELLGSLTDRDGSLRPQLEWQVNDILRLQLGADVVWGRARGLFGQFARTDRFWTRLRLTL